VKARVVLESGNREEFSMNCYIRVPLAPGGVAVVKGAFERVFARDDATGMEEADANYLKGKAYTEWHELDWQIEKISERKYIVKAERN
jgi:hypothetical protein